MPETMVKRDEVVPVDYFTPFTPPAREFFDFFNMPDNIFTWPRFFKESVAPPMRIEQFTEKNHLVVRAELPGSEPEKDVRVTFENGGLHIRAERHKEIEEEREGGYFTEMKYGKVARFVPLPEGVTEKDVKASYKNGVLELRIVLPKEVATHSPVTIPIAH